MTPRQFALRVTTLLREHETSGRKNTLQFASGDKEVYNVEEIQGEAV